MRSNTCSATLTLSRSFVNHTMIMINDTIMYGWMNIYFIVVVLWILRFCWTFFFVEKMFLNCFPHNCIKQKEFTTKCVDSMLFARTKTNYKHTHTFFKLEQFEMYRMKLNGWLAITWPNRAYTWFVTRQLTRLAKSVLGCVIINNLLLQLYMFRIWIAFARSIWLHDILTFW